MFGFRDLVDENELSQVESSLGSASVFLKGMPYSVQSGCENVQLHYDVLTLDSMSHVLAIVKRVIGTGADSHLFRSALQFGQ